MRLALVFDKLREDTLGGYFERAATAMGLEPTHFWARDAQTIPSGFDLYLRIDHGDYHHDMPDHVHPRIFYAVDTHLSHSWPKIRRAAKRYKVVCCAHRDGASRLANGVWLPVACDPALHQASSPADRIHDVACVGTEGGIPRKFYLQALRERYPANRIGHAPHTQLGAIYGATKIGFNYSIRQDVNMRMFEILCAGALLLTNQLPHDDLAQLGLMEGMHYVTYRDPEELMARLDHYLRDHDQRQLIARRGQRLVLERHTYGHRLAQILRLANERLDCRFPIKEAETATCASS